MNSTGRPVAVDWAIAKDRYEAKMCKIEVNDASNTEEVKLNGSVKQKNVSSLAAEKNILPKGKVKEEISEDSESGKKKGIKNLIIFPNFLLKNTYLTSKTYFA